MKKQFLALAFAAIALVNVQAQDGIKASAYVGAPVGNASDFFSFHIGADIAYFYPVMDNLGIGGKIGLDLFSGKDISNTNQKNKGATYIPIAATAQYNITDDIFAGADIGFALSLSDSYKGGFYFLPKAGWQNDTYQIFAFGKSITSDVKKPTSNVNDFSTITTIGIGAAYKF